MDEKRAAVTLIEGGSHADERGCVGFVNGFDLTPVRRFYTLSFAQAGGVRAWVGHRFERKWFFAASGELALVLVEVDAASADGGRPPPVALTLDGRRPQVVAVPAGYYIGMKALSDGTQVVVFSDKTLAESQGDVVRCEAERWVDWGEIGAETSSAEARGKHAMGR